MEPGMNAGGFAVSLPAPSPLQTPCSQNILLCRTKNPPRHCQGLGCLLGIAGPKSWRCFEELLKMADKTSSEKPAPLAWRLPRPSGSGTARGNDRPTNQRLLWHPRACVQAPWSTPSKAPSTTFKIHQFFLA